MKVEYGVDRCDRGGKVQGKARSQHTGELGPSTYDEVTTRREVANNNEVGLVDRRI